MNIFERIQVNLADISAFGPAVLWRHSPRLSGAHTALVSLAGKTKIHLRAGESDVAAVRQIFARNQYDAGFIRAVGDRISRRYSEIIALGKIPVIVDAGANIGAASLWFTKKYDAAYVVAIEPERENFRVLEKNAKFCKRIRPMHAAIGSTPGFVVVNTNGLGWASQTVRAQSGIPIITMRDAFDSVPDGLPFIAKIDIEGFESDLFSRNTEWLAETYVVFIEPHDWLMPGQMTSRSFQAAMGHQDYEIFIAGEILTYVRR